MYKLCFCCSLYNCYNSFPVQDGNISSDDEERSVGRFLCLPQLLDVCIINIWGYTEILPILGSFSNDDGDGNQAVKKAIGLLRNTTTLHVHHAFLYISSPSLHDYDVKMPNCKFYGGRKQATTNLFFSV